MSGFLLDTNVVSEPSKPAPNAGLASWMAAADETTLHLSVVTIGEIRRGIDNVEDPLRKAKLEAFFAALRTRFSGRILPIDEAVAQRWGSLTAALTRNGAKLPAIDALIAATAIQHQLTVVTRNDTDFVRAGVPVLNPFT